MKKVLFTATVDSHILHFHIPFLKQFKENGYEVHVATNGDEEIPFCDKKIKISFERSPYSLNNLKAIKELKKVINEEKYDIIHTHTPMGSVVTRLAAKSARKKYSTRVIYTAHGFHFFKGASKLNWLLFYPVEKFLAKYTDTLITINMEDYNLAKDKFSKRCKNIEYVPGVGIDEEKFNFKMTAKEKKDLRNSLGLTEDDFVLIYPAELNKNKNQLMLINAMEELVKKHKNIKLLLPGKDSYNGYYQNIVKEKNLDEYIKFLGYRKDIPKLLKISNLSVASSLREGLPVNLMEAMYVGLPIIATDCRGQRDLVKNNENGYIIDVNDTKDFIKKVEKVYKNKEIYDKFSKNNKEIIKEYLLEDIMIKMNKIYNKKKRVLHLLASNKYSGAENVVCMIIKNTQDEYESIYCSPKGSIKNKLEAENIEYLPLEKFSFKEIKKAIKKYNPHIIHAHDNKATVIASGFHKKHKIISHIHGNNKIMNSFNIKTILFNICSKNVETIIWVSDSSYNDYYFKNAAKNKSNILYNVINQQEIINKAKLWNCDKTYDLIFLGRLAYPKNPERLIEIIKLLKDKEKNISVAIVGDGEDRLLIEKLIQRYKLNENITMYGFKTNPYPILANSKILIMTSIYEGTPMCALEAQALKKPIVATPVDGLKKIIENGINGYLTDDNSKMVDFILKALSNELNYNKLSKNSQKKFELYNDVEKYNSYIKEVYKKALEK